MLDVPYMAPHSQTLRTAMGQTKPARIGQAEQQIQFGSVFLPYDEECTGFSNAYRPHPETLKKLAQQQERAHAQSPLREAPQPQPHQRSYWVA